MKTLFIDTGFLLALEIKNDQNHATAKGYWQQFKQSPVPLLTTTYVLDETVTFLNSRGWHEKAIKVGQSLLNSPLVQTIHIDETLFWQGWAYFQKHSDKAYSLTDALSFIVMQQENIQTALSFDKHFTQAGFLRIPN